jgi:hypothetical protein
VSKNKNLNIIYTITDETKESSSIPNDGWKGERGFINKAMLVKYLSTEELDNSIFYICGPPGMLKAMQLNPISLRNKSSIIFYSHLPLLFFFLYSYLVLTKPANSPSPKPPLIILIWTNFQ